MTDTPTFLMSPQQARTWHLGSSRNDAADLVVQLAVRLDPGATLATISAAAADAVKRHEILRTTYAPFPGRVVGIQVVHEALEPATREAPGPLASVLADEAAPFALDATPLRLAVVDPGGANATLVITMTSLAADGASAAILASEISEAAAAGDEPLQYADYSAWQEGIADSDDAPHAAERWAGRVVPQAARLPFQGDVDTRQRSCVMTQVVPVDVGALRAAAEQLGAPEAIVVQAAWLAWLGRATGATDIGVETLFDGRSHPELEGALGAFSRYAPVRVDLDANPTLAEVVSAVALQVQEGETWQDFAPPGAGYGEGAAPPPAFAAVASAAGSLAFSAGLERFSVELRWLGDRVELVIDPAAVPASIVPTFAHSIGVLLDAAVAAPTAPISGLALLAEADRDEVVGSFNATAAPVTASSFTTRFEAQVERTPDRDAVGAGTNRMSYAALDAAANQLAHLLAARGVRRGSSVGLMIDRSTALMVGILGILKAGAAYVPLNFEHPRARLAHQLHETGASVVVTLATLASLVPDDAATVLIDPAGDLAAASPTRVHLDSPVTPEDPAYVLYTSGSTGTPKGVVVTHANLVNYATYLAERLEVAAGVEPGAGLRCGVVSAISTDLGNTCIFPPLLSGGCVELVAAETAMDPFAFAAHLVAHPIDVLKITPSHLGALFEAAGAAVLPDKVLVLGGEASSWDLVGRIRAAAPTLTLLNHYGPTETTIGACTFDIGLDAGPWRPATVPIGRPIANTTCDVVDEAGQPLPIGLPGELLIGGAGVATGYVGQPQLTDERFVADAWRPGARVYRTGDRVRRLPDGALEFLGRVDDQVKIRGYRIEPREIEAVLLEHPLVSQVAVVARADSRGDQRLVAYVVAVGQPGVDQLRAVVAAKLPDFMAPAAYVQLEALPLTPSGKLDRLALPDPDSVTDREAVPYVAPRTETEALLAAAWAEVLGLDRVGIHEDFFALGGHSLLATQVIARARQAVGVELPLHALFIAPTVAGLAEIVNDLLAGTDASQPGALDEDDELAALLAELDGMTEDDVERLLGDG